MLRQQIFDEINNERQRQVRKWGDQTQENPVWLTILMEEVGEVSEEILEVKFYEKSIDDLRTELIQVAAVAVSWLEDLERK